MEKKLIIRYNETEVNMQRYFNNQKNNNTFIMNDDDSNHIYKVMRMKIGDEIEVICEEKLYICEIMELGKNVLVKVKESKNDNNELPVKITICQSLVNENKMDLILQKGCELGAYEFIPYNAKNSVVKENNKSDKKLVRWQRIVKEASEQSKRNIIPKVKDIINLSELCKLEYDLKLLCTVNEFTVNLKKVFEQHKKYDTIIIVIGPEGGFDKTEEVKLIANGFISVSLGKRVFRTETASLVALSYINYELMR